MLRITGLALPPDYCEQDLRALICRKLGIQPAELLTVTLWRRSVDARDKQDVHFVISADVGLISPRLEEKAMKKCRQAEKIRPAAVLRLPKATFSTAPLVVGAGPAGLFAALELAKAGARPILIERGRSVENRAEDVERMRKDGILCPESNVQFGEGGAGAFSDGKLTCGVKSPYMRQVLETFVRHGAPEEILYLQKPHIGTDRLRSVVASIREEIIALGGQVSFDTRLTSLVLHGSRVAEAVVFHNDREEHIRTDTVLLCIGHSARDTVQTLFGMGVRMAQKPFAMGVRIEHRQEMIDRSQYGPFAGHPALGAADYKLNVHTPDDRGVYTFCMCPGGHVIAAASQPGGLVVNGMSYHARDAENANAALLVGVRPGDYGDDHPLAGMVWQRAVEKSAFRIGGGDFRAPVQRVEDFLNKRASVRLGDVAPSYRPGVTLTDLRECLPGFIADDLMLGIRGMDSQLKGFAHPDAVLTGVETRSSSPVRILRGKDLQAEGISGLYPVGEGAGYAGGIVSAALDGICAAVASLNAAEAGL